MPSVRIVHRVLIEEYSETDSSQFDSHRDDHHAGNHRWEKLAQAVDQPTHADLACAGKDHHAASHRKSKDGRSRHRSREINRGNNGRAKVPRTDPSEAEALQDG